MTSIPVAQALLHKLNFLDGDGVSHRRVVERKFLVDFDSDLSWPDLPYATASPSSRYADDARPSILRTLDDADRIFSARAPAAWAFIDEHLDRAMIRRSDAVAGASSSSNRELIGVCLLTNLHLADDPVSVSVEALVHETIHQYLYRTEQQSGNFCDLGDRGRYRSPWSGNRIPLHSLVHASLVWYGLLTLWCQLAQSFADDKEAVIVRNRVAPTLFGFSFVRQLIAAPTFPRAGVQPGIIELIDRLADVAAAAKFPDDVNLPLGRSLRMFEDGGWISRLKDSLQRIEKGVDRR